MVIADTAFKSGFRVILTSFDWSIPDGIIVRRVGTPWYKCIDKSVTEESDIFTFGIILCELLTGSNPYQHNGICEDDLWLDWVQNHRYEEPASLNNLDIKPALNKIMAACLDANPMNRPSLREIKSALEGHSEVKIETGISQNGNRIHIEPVFCGAFCKSYKICRGDTKYFLKEYSDATKLSHDYYAFIQNQELMIPRLKALGDKTETIIDHFEIEDRYYQLKEWIEGKNLKSWMDSNTNYNIRLDVAIQMCNILRSIHDQNIIHYDLKPRQFMVVLDATFKSGFRVILTDFDWSIPDGIIVRRVGTPWYKCIDKSVTEMSDIFTFGIVLWELLTGVNPYQHNGICDDESWIEWVQNHKYILPDKLSPEVIGPELNNIMVACLDANPINRPSLHEIKSALESELFNSTKYKTVKKKKVWLADVVFCFDCRASMQPYIDRLKQDIDKLMVGLDFSQEIVLDWQVMAMGYRNFDLDSEKLINHHPFVKNANEFAIQLDKIIADGGVCESGSTIDAIWYALKKTPWRENASKFIVLFTDATTQPISDYTLKDLGIGNKDVYYLIQELYLQKISFFMFCKTDPVYQLFNEVPRAHIVQYDDPETQLATSDHLKLLGDFVLRVVEHSEIDAIGSEDVVL